MKESITAREIIMNQMLDNARLTIMPPFFETPFQAKEKWRVNQALRLVIKNGVQGKIFCWHDYTYLVGITPYDVGEYMRGMRYLYGCVKCGKQKNFRNLQLENIV